MRKVVAIVAGVLAVLGLLVQPAAAVSPAGRGNGTDQITNSIVTQIGTVGSDTFEVQVLSLGSGPIDPHPPAGVHLVVQMQGKPVSFLSPRALEQGTSGSLSSGWDIPYSVRVDLCLPQDNQFRISGTIGV